MTRPKKNLGASGIRTRDLQATSPTRWSKSMRAVLESQLMLYGLHPHIQCSCHTSVQSDVIIHHIDGFHGRNNSSHFLIFWHPIPVSTQHFLFFSANIYLSLWYKVILLAWLFLHFVTSLKWQLKQKIGNDMSAYLSFTVHMLYKNYLWLVTRTTMD